MLWSRRPRLARKAAKALKNHPPTPGPQVSAWVMTERTWALPQLYAGRERAQQSRALPPWALMRWDLDSNSASDHPAA